MLSGSAPVFKEQRAVPVQQPAHEKRNQGRAENDHHHVLKPGSPIGAQPGKGEEGQNGSRRNELRKNFDVIGGKDSRQNFSETDAVKGDGNRLGQEHHDADGASEWQKTYINDEVTYTEGYDIQQTVDANMNPEEIDHINTHGTSTPLGDVAELKAISAVFGDHAKNININSTKSMTGHLLGAAGAIEAIASILAIKYGIIPPTINHTVVDENINPELNLTLNKAQKRDIKVAMSNTFGFGGHNACVLFKKLEE